MTTVTKDKLKSIHKDLHKILDRMTNVNYREAKYTADETDQLRDAYDAIDTAMYQIKEAILGEKYSQL